MTENTTIALLPLAASICLLTAMVQAWLMTAVRYFKAKFVRNMFPNYRDLVRSHVDYLMMASLIIGLYLMSKDLAIDVPDWISWMVFVGALYNPFGFVLQAIKPDIADSWGIISKLGVVLGFMPLTIGLIWFSLHLIIDTYRLL